MDQSPLQAAIWFAPWSVGGALFALFSSSILHCVPGHVLLTIASVSNFVAFIILGLTPKDGSYWRYIFPSMLAELACVDVLWTTSNVYLTNSLPEDQQGIAGAFINFTLFFGCSVFLAFASWMEMMMREHSELNCEWRYRVIFFVNAGISALVAVFCMICLRLEKDEGRRSDPLISETDQPRGWKALGASLKSFCLQTKAKLLCTTTIDEEQAAASGGLA